MLRDGQIAPDKTAQAFAAIDRNGEVLAMLVDDLLDMSRMTTGRLQLDSRPLDINAVVHEAVTLLEPTANAKNILVRAEIESESLTVDGDPTRLRQVMWNLLSNAVKFTPPEGRITLRLRRVDSHAEISVVDTGNGIAPDFLPRVFHPFSQAEEGNQGLGLGLAIAQQLVDAHKGRISVVSDGIGTGATFTVRLPLLRN
jgi:two-component system CheB/CheR fusion protein